MTPSPSPMADHKTMTMAGFPASLRLTVAPSHVYPGAWKHCPRPLIPTPPGGPEHCPQTLPPLVPGPPALPHSGGPGLPGAPSKQRPPPSNTKLGGSGVLLPELPNWVPAREVGRLFPLVTGSGNICREGGRAVSGDHSSAGVLPHWDPHPQGAPPRSQSPVGFENSCLLLSRDELTYGALNIIPTLRRDTLLCSSFK